MRVILLVIMLCAAGCGLPTHLAGLIPMLTQPEQAAQNPTPSPELAGTPYVVIGSGPANARIEPVTIGPVVAELQPGETVMVVGTISAQIVGGSDQWHVIERDGRRLYVHSNRLAQRP